MTFDVIIAGAGPVGLFLACELALARCSVLVLEKAEQPHASPKKLPFGIRGLSAPTIEALHRRDLRQNLTLHTLMDNPHSATAAKGKARQGGHFAGIPFLEEYIDSSQWTYRLPSSLKSNLLSEMEELESVLTRRAESSGVVLKRGFGLTAFHEREDGVTVTAGDVEFSCKWLVGCDGSRSMVRKLGRFDFVGTEPEFTGYSARVDLVNPESLGQGRNLTATGMYFRSQPGYLVLVEFDGGRNHRTGTVSLDEFQAVLQRVAQYDIEVQTLHAVTTWTDRARQATNYRSGRTFLAGDAAHIHSPLGGQGLNLGLGDAMNLGWKLASTIHGTAPEGLLDTYQTERHPIGAQVLNWSRAQVAIMRPDPSARALNAIVRDLINTRDGATYIASRVWGILTRYDLRGDHPLVGRSVPNFEFTDGLTIGDLMHGGQGILLDFNGAAPLRDFAREFGPKIKYIAGQVQERFDLSAALIRPDGIVAWVSTGTPNLIDLEAAVTRWFTKESSNK